MWGMFKLVRWIITSAALLWLWSTVTGEGISSQGTLLMAMVYGQFVFWPLLILWVVPTFLRHRPPAPKKHDPAVFNPDISHDNVALDTQRDRIWVRDPLRGERFLAREDVLAIRTAHDFDNGVCRRRLEFQLRDVAQPLWQVHFQRHSDRRAASGARNNQELAEWFARLKTWTGLQTVR